MKRGFLNTKTSTSKVQQETKNINKILKFIRLHIIKLLSNSFETKKIENENFIVYLRLLV
jgi:hypothetical protein